MDPNDDIRRMFDNFCALFIKQKAQLPKKFITLMNSFFSAYLAATGLNPRYPNV